MFRPSDGSWGAVFNNIGQSTSATSSSAVIPSASPAALPESRTGDDHPSPADPPPQSSPVLPPRSVSPSVMTTSSTGTKRKHSARQSAGSLSANTNFVNDFMSTSDGSSRSQTNTNSKRQKVTGAAALLATSEELKDFNSTVRDLISSKEARNKQERRERASSSERRTKAMVAFQKQESGWLSFDHQIAMIDHFKLDVGSADAYMTLELPALRRTWVKKQLKDMQYMVDDLNVDEGPVA